MMDKDTATDHESATYTDSEEVNKTLDRIAPVKELVCPFCGTIHRDGDGPECVGCGQPI